MANIKSQIKRNRQNEAARQRNKAVKSSLKTAVRKANDAIDAGDAAAATEAVQDASRKLDKAATKGVIHKNQAASNSHHRPPTWTAHLEPGSTTVVPGSSLCRGGPTTPTGEVWWRCQAMSVQGARASEPGRERARHRHP